MDTAGLLLGVIPIVVEALKCYKKGKELLEFWRNRRRHIDVLIRALNGHRAVLEIQLTWLLRTSNLYSGSNSEDARRLLQEPATLETIYDFLGHSVWRGFQDAIYESQDATLEIIHAIREIPVSGRAASHTFQAIMNKPFDSFCHTFANGVKFTLKRERIDGAIKRLDRASTILHMIQSTSSANQQLESSNVTSRASRQIMRSLTRVQEPANLLYQAIRSSWAPECHPLHMTKLFIEDRLTSLSLGTHGSQPSPVVFHMIIVAGAENDCAWQKSVIEVRHCSENCKAKAAPVITKPDDSARPVVNMCKLVREADGELRLCILSPQAIYHAPCTTRQGNMSGQTVSLSALITASSVAVSRKSKMDLRPRLLLALTLASTLFQLHPSPWLGSRWNKQRIHFLAPSVGDQINPSEVDISQPLVTGTFARVDVGVEDRAQPRDALLLLGIMLLELWHEVSIEDYFVEDGSLSSTHDYLTQSYLALRWLEATVDSILPAYYDIVAWCIRYHINWFALNASGEDSFEKGVLRFVLEPLHAMCYPRREQHMAQ